MYCGNDLLGGNIETSLKIYFCNLKFAKTWHICSSSIYELTWKGWDAKSFLKNSYENNKIHVHILEDKNPEFLSCRAHSSEIYDFLYEFFKSEFTSQPLHVSRYIDALHMCRVSKNLLQKVHF